MVLRATSNRGLSLAVAVLALAAVMVGIAAVQAEASYLEQGVVVSDDPVDYTPHAIDGRVYAITTVGDRVIVGGTFTGVKNAGDPTVLPRNYIFAFNRNTGVIDTGFVPVLDGLVETLAAAPDGTSVFVGGVFANVNGTPNFGLAKLDVSTGQMVPGFSATTAGKVRDLEVSGNTLYVGGDIWSVNGIPRTRMAAVDVTTGAVDPTFTVSTTAPRVSVDWVAELAVHPDGSEMTIVGNFLEVDGLPRAQIAVIDLTGPTAVVADWSTDQYAAGCSSSFWTYMRDLEYAPSGEYLAVVTTGGPRPPTLCDTAARWEVGMTGSGLLETWADWSGGDTLTAVAVSDVAVYIGGHQRWMNNHIGRDFPGDGAVVRDGVAALDPINGVPLAWNPGKDRGVAVWDLHLSDLGLYVGSDTDIAAGEYHAKLVQFPLAGGLPVPVPTPAVLPADLFAGEGTQLTTEVFDGLTAGTPTVVAGNTMNWATVGGAFHQAGRLYSLGSTGELQSRTFDGVTMGAPDTEPSWVDWTGATSATWWDGKLFYTVSGSSQLRYQYFSLDSGIVGSQTFVVSGDGDGLNWSTTTGMAAAEGKLYYTDATGDLYSIDLLAGDPVPGTDALISGPTAGDGRNWAGTAIFIVKLDTAPVVVITAPVDAEAVAGDVLVTADATDDVAVTSVEFEIDGVSIGIDTDGSDGWSALWDSTTSVEGPAVITAIGRDSGDQTGTDSITVTVDNLGPTTVLTAPVDGAIVSGSFTVTADVTDEVGVDNAEFFVNGSSIGVDTDGSDGWSVDWDTTAVSDGSTSVSVVGTDTFSRTSSDGVTVTVDNLAAGIVVIVVADPGNISATDDATKTRLESLGYAVTFVDDSTVTPAAVEGAALVIVSSYANSYVLAAKLNSAPQPIWVAKPWSLDDMGLTGTVAGTDYGSFSRSAVNVVDPAHPMSGGYSGSVTVTPTNQAMSFGTPGPGADLVSTADGRGSSFVYAQGATLADGSTAAGCRIHASLFKLGVLQFTADGWALFDAVANYGAAGCNAPPIDTAPTATVTAPADGATVIGTVTVTADAVDDDAVTQVEFFVDGGSIGVDTNGADGWSQGWDTTGSADGSVTVTATATDTATQTGSDSISVTVDNLGPAVAITAPLDGATVHSSVTIVADTGGDPTVTQVEFFVDGGSIGVDTNGADGWSQDWDTTTSANTGVTVSATATDSSLRTGSDLINVTVDNTTAGFVTMVVGNPGDLPTYDIALRDRLEANGYVVTIIDDSVATAADADGASFVFVASSVNAPTLGDTFKDVTVPVWVTKPWSLDDMGMTGTTQNTDYGNLSAETLVIVDDTHTLAGGFTGSVVVTTANRATSWGLPNGNAEIVATVNGNPNTFVYHAGTTLADGSTAAGCRVFTSALKTSVLSWTADGWSLFDTAAAYAADGCP